MMAYEFDAQLVAGKRGEARLDAWLAPRGQLRVATLAEERRGIDRYLTDHEGREWALEYKTDYRAQDTHNAFLETVSVDSERKPGWVYSCQADYIAYYVPGEELIYWLRPARVRQLVGHLSHWRPTPVANERYRTWGFVVPLRCLERIADRVESL